MKRKITIFFVILLLSLSRAALGQLFMQNFSSSLDVTSATSPYISPNTAPAAPQTGRFTWLNTTAGTTTDINAGMLRFQRGMGGGGYLGRNTGFSNPTSLIISFDISVTNALVGSTTTAALLRIGDSFNNNNASEPNTSVYARLGINILAPSGQFQVRDIRDPPTIPGVNSATFSGQQKVMIILNKTGAILNYAAPNGTLQTVGGNDKMDVWVGATNVFDEMNVLTSSIAMNHFKLFYDGGNDSSISLDNFYINTVGGALSSGNYTLGTNGDFQSITNAGGVFNVLNNLGSVATGGYNFGVAADLTAETGVNPLNQISGMSSGNQVKITASSNGRIISGSGNPLINFNGADFVSIDGGNGGTITGANRMTIRNTTASATTFRFINDATNHAITDCLIESNSTAATVEPYTGSTFLFSTGTTTGNDIINVSKCVIRNRTDIATANPRLAINSTGSSSTVSNDNITFDACEFINFFASVSGSSHIALIQSNTSNFTLKNSSIYQTATYNTVANGIETRLITINGTNTNNITIDGNFFGGRAVSCGGGAYIYSTSVAGNRFSHSLIQSAMVSGRTLTIQNNTFKNIQTDFFEATAATANQWLSIAGTGKLVIKSNIFSNLRFSINNGNASPASTVVQAINYQGDGAGEITSNTIEDIQFSFAGSPSTAITNGFSFDALRIDPAGAGLVISQNTIGSTSVANSILCNASTSINALRGINVVSALNTRGAEISQNIISNITHNCTSANTASELIGIKTHTPSIIDIIENNINNLNSKLQIASAQAVVSVAGISASSSSTYTISKNIIHSITCSAVPATGANACGILLDGGISGTVEKQIIYNIRNTSTGTTPAAAGIISRNLGGSMTIYNNMISLGVNTNGTPNTEDAMYIGLWNNTNDGDNITFVYNSVAISGSITNGTKSSYGFLRGNNVGASISTPVQLINNLFYNERQELGVGSKHFAMGNQQVICNNWGGCTGVAPPCVPASGGAFLPNYNALYSANASTIGEWLGISQTFANWQTATQADDKSTVLAASMTFTDIKTGNLHILSSEFRLNAVALPLYLSSPLIILTDYDGDFRRGADIGADEVENTVTFTGATDNWNNIANWTPNIVPTCADIAVIPTGKSVKIYAGTIGQCYRLLVQAGGQLTLENNTSILEQCWLNDPASGFTHDGYVAIQASGTLTMNNGTLRVAGNFIHDGSFDKGTSTTELNLDRPTGNTCITNHINSYNIGLNTSDINNTLATNFHNLTILNSGKTTITKDVTVGDATTKLGIFDITDGSTFIVNGNKLSLEGTLAERIGTITGSVASKLHILGKGNLVGTLKFASGGTEDFQEVVMNRIDNGAVKGLAILGNISPFTLQINNFLDLTAGILKTGTIAVCPAGGAATLEISITNNNLSNSIKNYNPAGYASTGGWVWGNLRRAITGTGLYSFPVGDASRYQLFNLDIKNALTGTTNILGYFNQCDAPNSGSWTANDVRGSVTFVYNNVCIGGYWRMTPNNAPSGLYDVEVFPVSILCAYPAKTIGKSVEGAGMYVLGGSTHVNDTKRTGYTSFSDFSLITTIVFLPVNLLSFNAVAQENNALVVWETAQEKDNSHFEVQKSIDGRNFTSIGRVQGKGNSLAKNKYQLIDNEPHKGVSYYRLKQIDLDSKASYSKIISLYFDGKEDIFSISPNPTNRLDINIILSAKANNLLNIKILDAVGKSIFIENQTYQGQIIQLKSNETIAKGIYFIVIQNLTTGKTHSRKLIIE